MMKKKGLFALITGSVIASLGYLGAVLASSVVCISCAVPAVGYILTFLGIIGISADVLATHNVIFSLLGMILLIVGLVFIFRKQKTC